MDGKLFEAAALGGPSLIQKLREPGVDYDQATPLKNTILHIAARYNPKGISGDVLRLCPTLLRQPNDDGDTPLHIAATVGSREMVELLIRASEDIESQRADIRTKNFKEEDTALHVAVKNRHFDVATLLMEKDPGLLDMVNRANETPLFLAVEGDFLKIAQHILEQFPSARCRGSNGMNALHAAVIRAHHAQVFEYRAPDLSMENIRRLLRRCLLHADQCINIAYNSACQPTQIDIMRLLLKKRGELAKEKDGFEWTPLHCAAHLGHVEATQLLLEYSSTCVAYLPDNEGSSSCVAHLPTCVAHLPDKEGMSALHIASREGHVRVMKKIIHHIPDSCDLVDNRGWTPLHVAVVHQKLNVVRYIMDTPKLSNLINATDKEGNTPLHLAAARDKYSIIKILVDDTRVHKKVQNRKYQKAIDLIHTNPNIGELYKSIIEKKLDNQGGRPSLQALVHKGMYGRIPIMDRLFSKVGSKRAIDFDDQKTKEVIGEDKEMKSHRLKNISNIHLLVASLIATVTFTAGFTMPGGNEQDTSSKGVASKGVAVLSNKTPFHVFVIADSIAFYCSSASVFLQFCGSVEHNYHLLLRFTRVAATLTYLSSLGMVVAFTSAMFAVMPNSSMLAYFTLVSGSCCVLVYIFGFL